MNDEETKRPVGAYILVVLTGIALVVAIVNLLQALGIVPYVIGRVEVKNANIWYVLLWGLMVWVWLWATIGLWQMNGNAWIVVLIIAGANLMFDFVTILISNTTWTDLGPSFVISLLVFAVSILPGTFRAFGDMLIPED